MNKSTAHTIQLAQTRHGEITLCQHCGHCYNFRFNNIHQHLAAEEFHQLHHYVVGFDIDAVFQRLIQLDKSSVPRVFLDTSLPVVSFCFTEAELWELKILLGKAALYLCTLSKALNEVN